jgi:hypothetical protein
MEPKNNAKIKKPTKTLPVTKPRIKIPFNTILDAKIDLIQGMSASDVSLKHGVSKTILDDRIARVDEISNSTLPALSVERAIISEALADRLKPIKEELSLKSLEIVREADKIVLERLMINPDDLSTKDVLRASEAHSARLARITGLEEDPTAGGDDPTLRAKNVNVFIQNIFKSHKEKLERDRLGVNYTAPKPIYDEELNP